MVLSCNSMSLEFLCQGYNRVNQKCFQGMRTQGGAAGVGWAATSSVVLSSLFVILADVVLVKLILIFFP